MVNGGTCEFAVQRVAYLGHIISASGVSVDEDKIATMKTWPTPRIKGVLRTHGVLSQVCERIC